MYKFLYIILCSVKNNNSRFNVDIVEPNFGQYINGPRSMTWATISDMSCEELKSVASTRAPDGDFEDSEIVEHLRRSREQPVIRRDQCIGRRIG